MTGNPLRWADPETAAAWFDLRDLEPKLSGLLYCGSMPEQQLSVLLDWSEALVSQDCSAAFGLDRLGEVLPALVRAFVASHTYAKAEPWDSGRDVVELYDTGYGSVVGRALPLTRPDRRWRCTATRAGGSSRRPAPSSPAPSRASKS